MIDKIIVKGARENNLKNISLELPKNKLIVMTGLSGSGKSTLAFDTICKEGERRFIESLSASARQFLGSNDKADVDSILESIKGKNYFVTEVKKNEKKRTPAPPFTTSTMQQEA